ncbi:MAG: diguanylate cyclase [Rhodocyclaceae bacterium]|nr:MAG: diguanylate cyclase [Rhodocyclaceae bacterium]
MNKSSATDQDTLQTIIDFLPGGITMFTAEQRMVVCNQNFRTLLEFPDSLFAEGLPTLYDLALFNANRGEYGPGDPQALAAQVSERARSMQRHVFERQRPNGTILEIRGEPLPSGGWVSIYTDITDRKRNEENLRRVKDMMSAAINFSPTFIWETNAEGKFTHLQGIEHILGFAEDELLGLPYRALLCDVSHSNDCEVNQHMQALEPVERVVVEAKNKAGASVWLSTSAQPVLDAGGHYVGYRGVDVDVTEITLARLALEELALHDPLTGLANRRKFVDRYQFERLRQSRVGLPLTLLMVDIDHFKLVNDNFGHIVGDVCLKAVADVLARQLRTVDLIARFGGEEFLVLLSDTDTTTGKLVAEKLRRALENHVIDIGLEAQPTLQITASFGVATILPAEDLTLEALIERADGAVYAAKRGGRNRVCSAESPAPGV